VFPAPASDPGVDELHAIARTAAHARPHARDMHRRSDEDVVIKLEALMRNHVPTLAYGIKSASVRATAQPPTPARQNDAPRGSRRATGREGSNQRAGADVNRQRMRGAGLNQAFFRFSSAKSQFTRLLRNVSMYFGRRFRKSM
jgi:hypothetical protein